MSGKPKVAFICVHNSCRSQIAEALGRLLAADTFESYSAGIPRTGLDYAELSREVYRDEPCGRSGMMYA